MLIVRGNTRVADIYFGEFMRVFDHHYARYLVRVLTDEGRSDPETGYLKERTKPSSMGGTTCPTHCPICPKSPRPAPAKLPTPSRWILPARSGLCAYSSLRGSSPGPSRASATCGQSRSLRRQLISSARTAAFSPKLFCCAKMYSADVSATPGKE
jgi:hypothetical protein